MTPMEMGPERDSITGFDGAGTQQVASTQKEDKKLRKVGAKYLFDIARNRSNYEIQHNDAALDIKADFIDMPQKACSRLGLHPHTYLDLTRIKIGYRGNVHSRQQAQQRIDALATYLGITDKEDKSGTREVVHNALERIQKDTT